MKNYSEYYRTRFIYDLKRNTVWKEIASYLQRYIPDNSVVLELGAGYCELINNIKAKEKHAVDVSSNLKHYANPSIKTYCRDAVKLKQFKENSFDVILASNFLEHLERRDYEKVIEEVHRVLKENGLFIIIQPNFKYCAPDYFDDYTHRAIFSHISLCDFLISEGFKIERVIPRFLPLSMRSKMPKFRLLVWVYLRSPIKPLAKQMLVIAKKTLN